MRNLLIALAIVGGLASVALCGSYGLDQGGAVLRDQVTQAFVYGMAAVFTLALHVAGIRVWSLGWRKTGVIIGVAGLLAFTMTAFTSLGGMASRQDRFVAERQDVLDTRTDTKTQIAALVAEKAGMKFRRATQATVDAAQLAVATAAKARAAECGDGSPKQRGPFCRGKEDAEVAAIKALADAQENKTATDRAIQIDDELKVLRSLKSEGTVGTANPLRDLLATIMGAWADLLTSWQKAAFVVIYDICLIATMIAIEVIGQAQNVPAKSPRREDSEPASIPKELPTPARPKLVVNNDHGLFKTLDRLLAPAPGKRIDIEDVYKAYVAQCRTEGEAPSTPAQFPLKKFCDAAGIKTRSIKGQRYLLDVQLVGSMRQAPSITSG